MKAAGGVGLTCRVVILVPAFGPATMGPMATIVVPPVSPLDGARRARILSGNIINQPGSRGSAVQDVVPDVHPSPIANNSILRGLMAPAARYEADTRGGDGSLRQELAARIAGGIQRANHLLGAAIAGRSCNITDATPKVIAVAKVRANIVIHICSSIAWQAGARPVSQPPAPGKEPQPMIRTACAYYWRQARHFFAIGKSTNSCLPSCGRCEKQCGAWPENDNSSPPSLRRCHRLSIGAMARKNLSAESRARHRDIGQRRTHTAADPGAVKERRASARHMRRPSQAALSSRSAMSLVLVIPTPSRRAGSASRPVRQARRCGCGSERRSQLRPTVVLSALAAQLDQERHVPDLD